MGNSLYLFIFILVFYLFVDCIISFPFLFSFFFFTETNRIKRIILSLSIFLKLDHFYLFVSSIFVSHKTRLPFSSNHPLPVLIVLALVAAAAAAAVWWWRRRRNGYSKIKVEDDATLCMHQESHLLALTNKFHRRKIHTS